MASVNATNIVLISKKKNPESIAKFKPISLCTVAYKLLTKIIANWLKKFLPSFMFSQQSAFLLGRLSTDNVIVAFALLHPMSKRCNGRRGFIALKLDINKAYD